MSVKLEVLNTPIRQDSYPQLPGPKTPPLIGVGLEFKKHGVSLLSRLARTYGDFVRFPMPGIRGVLVSDPAFIKLVFLQTERLFEKGKIYDRMKPLAGDGLVTSSAQLWRQQRRLANPAFNQSALQSYLDIIHRKTDLFMQSLPKKADCIDVYQSITSLTFQIALEALFSTDTDAYKGLLMKAFADGQDYIGYLFWAALPLPLSIPTARNRKFLKARETLYNVIDEIIALRQRTGSDRDDYLARLLTARDPETKKAMAHELVRDEIATFMLAGHDTTANTLSFTLWLLAQNHAIQEQVHQEIQTCLPPGGESLEDLDKLDLTMRCLQESMRLYPTAWMVNRTCKVDLQWGDYIFKKGTTFLLPQYAVHRHPRYWERPDDFWPDHFLAEKVADRPEFAFFPFGGGTRKCIGYDLAIKEALLIVVNVIRRYQIACVPDTSFTLAPNITMAPVPGITLKLTPRP
ncbi:cytochrome P450 [Oligoflexus tunisiensis]|uniref:cytochrome P450 n=1 Tax=Oligoflexus tunisiensis TaxID=708132 RepID=UPI00114D0519|nr:cytochrome P450 [Oligoflexus tunisiensis]